MISIDAIRSLAKKQQTTELNIRREYIQQLFLSYLYQQPHADTLYFKGGTALRILFHSPRFSQDLDFDSSLHSISTLEDMLVQTLTSIQRIGLETVIVESKKTSGGYLAQVSFSGFEKSIEIQLHISRRNGKKKGEVVTVVNDFIPSYPIVALVQEQLVEEKIRALLTRGKPRDFYDLYFILRAHLLPAKRKDVLKEAVKELRRSKSNFEKELKLFLPKSHWILLKDFRTVLDRECKRYL